MLTYLKVKGKIITADALNCQRETCKIIIEKKGDYVFSLKKNQKNLYEVLKIRRPMPNLKHFQQKKN